MLLHSLWLAERPNIGDGLKAALLRQFSSPEELYYCRESELAALEMGGMTSEALEALGDKSLDGAEKTLETCLKGGVSFLTPEDPKYPDRLRALYDAPVLLYYKGTLPEFDDLPTIALVGTRKASPYGLKTAQRLGGEIAQGGGLVVSGLAEGMDAAAMLGAPAWWEFWAAALIWSIPGKIRIFTYRRSARGAFLRNTLLGRRLCGGIFRNGTGSSAASAAARWW